MKGQVENVLGNALGNNLTYQPLSCPCQQKDLFKQTGMKNKTIKERKLKNSLLRHLD